MNHRTLKFALPAVLAASVLLLSGCSSNLAAEAKEGSSAPAGETQQPVATSEARSWDEISESGVLQVGTITDYPPNEFKTADGKPTGWAVELIEAIADELGLKVEYELLLFDNILPRIQGGTIDIGVGSFTDTTERESVVDFVNYYEAGTLWAAQPGSAVDPEAACGLSVAAMTGGTQHLDELPKRSKACEADGKAPIEILPFTGQPEVTNAVVSGQADAFSADSPVTIDAVGVLDGKLEVVGDLYDAAPYGFPLAKGSELAEPVQQALQTLINNGTYERILKRYASESGAVEEATINIASE